MNIAFIKDNVVINVAVFADDASNDLINEICIANGADVSVNTDTYSDVGVNYTWHGDHFRPPQPYPSWVWNVDKWDAPLPLPTDAIYSWDEETISWKFERNHPTYEEFLAEIQQQ